LFRWALRHFLLLLPTCPSSPPKTLHSREASNLVSLHHLVHILKPFIYYTTAQINFGDLAREPQDALDSSPELDSQARQASLEMQAGAEEDDRMEEDDSDDENNTIANIWLRNLQLSNPNPMNPSGLPPRTVIFANLSDLLPLILSFMPPLGLLPPIMSPINLLNARYLTGSFLDPSDPEPAPVKTVNPLDLELKSRDSSILPSGCAYCPQQSGQLYDCSYCRAATYCCTEHLELDRASHKVACLPIKASRARAEMLRLELMADNDKPFDKHLGHFWQFPKTKSYLAELNRFVELRGRRRTGARSGRVGA
jgi:hypothetical protein